MQAWLARRPTPAEPGRRGPVSTATSLVGREPELAHLRRDADTAPRRPGGLVFITGEAGIGKSRLVAELHVKAVGRGCGWLEGRTLSFGRTISYWPFLEIL